MKTNLFSFNCEQRTIYLKKSYMAVPVEMSYLCELSDHLKLARSEMILRSHADMCLSHEKLDHFCKFNHLFVE